MDIPQLALRILLMREMYFGKSKAVHRAAFYYLPTTSILMIKVFSKSLNFLQEMQHFFLFHVSYTIQCY